MDQYDTKLTPDEESKFQKWKSVNAPNDSGEDYDLRGLYMSGGGTDERGHATDKFKKPNHPTFSTQSQYHTPQTPGGEWIDRDGKSFFVPSSTNLQNHPYPELQDYFKKYEPDTTLVKQTGPTAIKPTSSVVPQ